jgi:hypothetical protein
VSVEFTIEPRLCGYTFGEHQCFLFNCPRDDPDHDHVCYANDCDWSARTHHRLERGEVSEKDLLIEGHDKAIARQESGVSAVAAQLASFQAVVPGATFEDLRAWNNARAEAQIEVVREQGSVFFNSLPDDEKEARLNARASLRGWHERQRERERREQS